MGIAPLLGDSVRIGRRLDRLAIRVADAIADTIDPPQCLTSQLQVMGYVLNAAAASRLLVSAGYARAAEAQLRAVLEGFAVIQCLQGNAAMAKEWRDASTRKDRGAFGYKRLKRCAPIAAQLSGLWDSLSEYVHTNNSSLPAHSRLRETFGFDIPAGPMYDPRGLAFVLSMSDGLYFLFIEWAIDKLVPSDARVTLGKRIASLGPSVKAAHTQMNRDAKSLARAPSPRADGIPREEQREAVASLRALARSRGVELPLRRRRPIP